MAAKTAKRSATAANDCYCKDEHFVAQFYQVSLGTVRRWRHLGVGPRYRKIGSLCRYSLQDLEDWLATRPVGGERPQEAQQ